MTPARLEPLLTVLAGWPRRLAAALCLLAAVATALTAHHPVSTAMAPVVVAERDLASGVALAATDLRVEQWPVADVPATALAETSRVLGRRIGAPMARGEPVTRARLLDTSVTAVLRPGQVASTVSVGGPNTPALFQAGSVVDLYAAAASPVLVEGAAVPGSAPARAVADAVTVLSVLPAAANAGSGAVTLVVATDRSVAALLAAHASGEFLATLVPPP